MPIFELPSNASDEEIEQFLLKVANNVKRVREEKGVSQFDLALTIGQKGSGLIACAETCTKGKRFNLIHLYKIAKALEVPIEEFFRDIKDIEE